MSTISLQTAHGTASSPGQVKSSLSRRARVRRNQGSFRKLRAFGLWADRPDVQDAVSFTQKLRKQMGNGCNAH
jgi:hypothetical protein